MQRDSQPPAALTEANLRSLGQTSNELKEEALLKRMQNLSELLAQVDEALDNHLRDAGFIQVFVVVELGYFEIFGFVVDVSIHGYAGLPDSYH